MLSVVDTRMEFGCYWRMGVVRVDYCRQANLCLERRVQGKSWSFDLPSREGCLDSESARE